MVYRGEVRGNTVVLEPGAHLPEGAVVRVELESSDALESGRDPLLRMTELAVETGIPDLAANFGRYLPPS